MSTKPTDLDPKRLAELLEPEYSRKRTIHFIVANLIAVGVCAAVFCLFLYGDFMTTVTDGIFSIFSKSELALVVVASLPLTIGLWMGVFYSRRRAQRKKVERLKTALGQQSQLFRD